MTKSISASQTKKQNLKKSKKPLIIGTLFSGIGAIEHALKRMSIEHEIAFAGDIDPFCKKTYFANHDIDDSRWHDDVTKFSAKKHLNKIDLLVGGSPCQSFSMVGKRGGLEDTRGTLFYDFARVVSECKPKVFIFENVRGLLNHDNGKTWIVIQKTLQGLGYTINSKTLNSRDYGIPQNRERIFVVGFKKNQPSFEFPIPIPLHHTMQDFLQDFTESKYYLRTKGVKFVTSSKNRLKRYTQISGEIALCQKANQQFNWHGDFIFEGMEKGIDNDEFVFEVKDIEEKYFLSQKVKKYVLAGGTKTFRTSTKTDLEVARPLLQSMHKMHRAGVDNYVTYKRGKIRKLTPRECLRLMGFRDSFVIPVSDTQMYRQAGNSIVVDVLIALIKQIDFAEVAKK